MPTRFEPLQPVDAIAALLARGKKLHPTFNWSEIYGEIHAAMFTVAKSAGHDVLEDIFQALLKALEEGGTFESFSKQLKPTLIDKGWWGRAIDTDPATGDLENVQLGSPRRLRTIFDVNMRVSYAAGHWANFERNKDTRPFLRYVAIIDDVTRPHHTELHNLVLPIDHPFWNVFAAPNGWNCRCTMQSLSQRDIDELIAEGVLLKFTPPAITYRPWLNKSTGEIRQIPAGVDPGWDYNPGKVGHHAITDYLTGKANRPIGGGSGEAP